MLFYALLSRVFPTSFTAKVLAIAFVGTHVPLVVLLFRSPLGGMQVLSSQPVWTVLVATLTGTAICFVALRAVLRPLYMVERAMQEFEAAGIADPLPFGYRDQVGRLMERTNRLVLHVNRKIDETQREADTDPLTGVLNRRGFERRVGERATGGMLMLDLDHFKRVNDTHGHEAGDRVLMAVALAIRSAVRPLDVVARYGGEEFVVFLPNAIGHEAWMVAERVRSTIESRVVVAGQRVTASIGVAQTRRLRQVSDLLAEADAGTYAAKAAGRNRVAQAGLGFALAAE